MDQQTPITILQNAVKTYRNDNPKKHLMTASAYVFSWPSGAIDFHDYLKKELTDNKVDIDVELSEVQIEQQPALIVTGLVDEVVRFDALMRPVMDEINASSSSALRYIAGRTLAPDLPSVLADVQERVLNKTL